MITVRSDAEYEVFDTTFYESSENHTIEHQKPPLENEDIQKFKDYIQTLGGNININLDEVKSMDQLKDNVK